MIGQIVGAESVSRCVVLSVRAVTVRAKGLQVETRVVVIMRVWVISVEVRDCKYAGSVCFDCGGLEHGVNGCLN